MIMGWEEMEVWLKWGDVKGRLSGVVEIDEEE